MMTPNQIRAAFPESPVFVGGAVYALPTLGWLQGAFWEYFHGSLWDVNLDKWKVRWECRDFARQFASMSQLCNALTAGGPAEADALAVGEFWYLRGGDHSAGHAINACFTDHGLVFLEPQTGLTVNLTPRELATCYFVRF